MTERTSTYVMADLDELLELERQALLTGNLEKIGRLIDRKESLIDELSVIEAVDASELAELNDKVKRNQGLLDHALQGIRSVSSRLAAMRRVKRTLDTYDSSGSKQSIILTKDGSVEKRA